MNKLNKLSLSLSTWFCMAEHGMKEMEILTRASASIISIKDHKIKVIYLYSTHTIHYTHTPTKPIHILYKHT